MGGGGQILEFKERKDLNRVKSARSLKEMMEVRRLHQEMREAGQHPRKETRDQFQCCDLDVD